MQLGPVLGMAGTAVGMVQFSDQVHPLKPWVGAFEAGGVPEAAGASLLDWVASLSTPLSSRLDPTGHGGTEGGVFCGCFWLALEEKVQRAFFIAEPDFFGTCAEVERSFVFHFLLGIAGGDDFHADFWGDSQHICFQSALHAPF